MKQILLLAAVLMLVAGCTSSKPTSTVQRPTADDPSEVHWRMYYEDQFNAYGKAPAPPADAPDVAWKAYAAEKDSYNLRTLRPDRGEAGHVVISSESPDGRRQRYGAQTCFIATAAYGTPWEKNVLTLRSFRERYLLNNALGRKLVGWYYDTSPALANAIAGNSWARLGTRLALTPLVVLAGAMMGNTTDIVWLTWIASAIGIVVLRVRRRTHQRA